MENKITPIGGVHRSARSLLAEIMNDPQLSGVAVFATTTDGCLKTGHFEIKCAEMALISVIAHEISAETMKKGHQE